jgi:ribulose-phosphate 3-epimerase
MDTPLSKLYSLIDDIQFVQVMSIARVGFQRQHFEESVLSRIAELRARAPHLDIAVDGGVSIQNIHALKVSGATQFIVGSALMNAQDPKKEYEMLKKELY